MYSGTVPFVRLPSTWWYASSRRFCKASSICAVDFRFALAFGMVVLPPSALPTTIVNAKPNVEPVQPVNQPTIEKTPFPKPINSRKKERNDQSKQTDIQTPNTSVLFIQTLQSSSVFFPSSIRPFLLLLSLHITHFIFCFNIRS